MGQKTVRFSDLSGEIISSDDTLARIVIHEHPELGDTAVEIEALADEATSIEKAALRVAVLDVYLPGEDEPRRTVLTADAFDALATDRPMSELMLTARPARRPSKAAASGQSRVDRTNYATLEHAGTPHKGRITEEERRLVREHFDQVNERLAAQGLRVIDLADEEQVDRYGLAELAAEQAGRPDDLAVKRGAGAAGPDAERAAELADLAAEQAAMSA